MSYPFYRQEYEWDCSLACVLMIADYYHRKNYNYGLIVQNLPYYVDLNLNEIENIGFDFGVFFNSYFVDWTNFVKKSISKPIICQVYDKKRFHFVVIYQKFFKWFLVADPKSDKPKWINKEKIKEIFVGVVLVSEPTVARTKIKKNKKLIYWANIEWGILVTLVTSLILTILVIGNQFFFKLLIDGIFSRRDPHIINNWLKAFGLLFLGRLIIRWILKKMIFQIEKNHKKWWISKFFWKMQWMSYQEHRKHSISWILESSGHLNEVLSFYFPGSFVFLQNIFILLFSLIIMMWIFPFLALITIFSCTLITIFGIFLSPWKRQLEWKILQTNEEFNKEMINNLQNRIDCKRRHLTWIGWRKWTHFYQKIQTRAQQKFQFENWQACIYQGIRFITEISIIYFLLKETQIGEISAGSFIFIFFLMNNIITYSQALVGYFWINQKMTKIRPKFDGILETNSKQNFLIKESKNKQIIDICNLNYEHQLGWKLWPKSLNLVIKNNLYVGGPPGVGKTTLLQLISGELKKNEKGQILWNKQPIESISEQEWQKQIFHITSKSQLISGTIMENIFNFRKYKTDLAKWEKYEIDRWLKKLKIDWKVKNNSLYLSNGQRQLIVFLSIFFCESSLVLIDEGLNSLPTNLKIELIQWLWKWKKGIIVIYAGHDPQLISIFEEKFFLDHEN